MLENKTTPITFERKIQQLEDQKKEKENLIKDLQLQILYALDARDMDKFDKIGMELKAVLAMNYDEKIAALKAQKAKVLQIPEKDPDYQEDILKDFLIRWDEDQETLEKIKICAEDEEIMELMRRRKILWFEMFENKICRNNLDKSNIGREEKIDLPSAPTAPETPATPELPETPTEPEAPAEPESAEKKNKKRPRINKELLLKEAAEAAKTRSQEKDQIKPIIIKKWLINEKPMIKDKNELKRIILEQFKTKEELYKGSYKTFASEYNANENNIYTITKSITWLITSLGLDIKSTWIKELKDYLYGGNSISEQAEKKDLKIKKIKTILLENFPTKKSLKIQRYKDFANVYNKDHKDTEKITTDLFRLAKSLGFQAIEAFKHFLYEEELATEPSEQTSTEKIDLPSAPAASVIPETADIPTAPKNLETPKKIRSIKSWKKEITLKTLLELQEKWIFNPEIHLWFNYIAFRQSLKSTEMEKKFSKSPISLTRYLGWRVDNTVDTGYQQLLWKRYCLVQNNINGDTLRELNKKIRDKERELLKKTPELLDKYNAEIAKKRNEVLWKHNKHETLYEKNWVLLTKKEIRGDDFQETWTDRPIID